MRFLHSICCNSSNCKRLLLESRSRRLLVTSRSSLSSNIPKALLFRDPTTTTPPTASNYNYSSSGVLFFSTNSISNSNTTSGRCHQSSLASAAAVVDPQTNDDGHDEDDAIATSNGSSRLGVPELLQQQQQKRKRPRLQDLRERLQEEESGQEEPQQPHQQLNSCSGSSSSSPIIQVTRSTTTTNGAKRKPTKPAKVLAPTSPSPQTSEEWRALLDTLDNNIDTANVLTDRLQRHHSYLRLSLSERCNLRCTYCMPAEGIALSPSPSHLLQTPELLQLAQHFVQLGVNKIKLTGGEPTLRRDLASVISGLKQLELPKQHGDDNNNNNIRRRLKVGMTTNGILLGPKLLPDLVAAGLDGVNLSLDTLKPDVFEALTRRPASNLERVWQALELLHDHASATTTDNNNTFQIKLNCVVMRGTNENEVADFVKLVQPFPHLNVRFIEYMPFTKNGWCKQRLVGYEELLQNQLAEFELQPLKAHDPHDTTKWYTTSTSNNNTSTQHHQPRIGFITSMSSHFCATCNRLRVSADGQFKVCLFDGTTTLNLRDALRAGLLPHELNQLLAHAVRTKKRALGGHVDAQDIHNDADNNRPMTLIGG